MLLSVYISLITDPKILKEKIDKIDKRFGHYMGVDDIYYQET
jgi:hypothetical protein